MFHARIRRRGKKNEELNITSFMNVLVVLVSFLLATTVFSHIAKLEMNLPGGGAAAEGAADELPPLQLEVTIRPDQIEVGDRNSGLMKELTRVNQLHDFNGLSVYLHQVKDKFPAVEEVTVLAEDETSYDDIVHTMDAVREYEHKVNGYAINTVLFPQVALGSAIADPRKAAAGGATTP